MQFLTQKRVSKYDTEYDTEYLHGGQFRGHPQAQAAKAGIVSRVVLSLRHNDEDEENQMPRLWQTL